MNGWEQLTAILFGVLMAAVTVMAVVKAWSDARTAAARAQLEAAKLYLQAQAGDPLHVPSDWAKGGGQ